MLSFIASRLLQTLPVLVGVSFIVFISVYLLPGDVTQALLGLAATKERMASLAREMGLDRPLVEQYLIWLGHLLSGDLGSSHVMRMPVAQVLWDKTVNSLLLAGASLLIVIVVSFLLATTAAAAFRSRYDRFVLGFTFLLAAMPVFWLGIVLIYALAVFVPVFPMAGMYNMHSPGGLPDLLAHLVLPSVTTAAASIAIVTRVTRGAVIEALNQPYVLAARAWGAPRKVALYRHAVRNALPTFINISGLQVGYLFGSVVFSEIIFAWPGIGLQLYTSIIARDGPMIQGCVLVVALLFVVGNVTADILIRWLDVQADDRR